MIAGRWFKTSQPREHRNVTWWVTLAIGHVMVSGCSEQPPVAPLTPAGTDFHLAAEKGQASTLKRLIDMGGDFDATRPKDGANPLIIAARRNRTECVRVLIAAGADLERADHDGLTALAAAASIGTDPCITLLIEAGANLEARDPRGRTPLMLAAASGFTSSIELLLAGGASLHAGDDQDMTALHWAARDDEPACIEVLIDSGAELEARDLDWKTPLLTASAKGAADSMDILLQRGADHTAANVDGATALHFAAFADNHHAVKCLLDVGVEIEARSVSGKTPLMYATLGYGGIIDQLAEAGANINTEDNDGLTAVVYAITSGRSDGWALSNLLRLDADLERPLYLAAMKSDIDVVEYLLDLGANVNSPLRNGGTVMDAVRDTQNEIANRDVILALLEQAAQKSSNN